VDRPPSASQRGKRIRQPREGKVALAAYLDQAGYELETIENDWPVDEYMPYDEQYETIDLYHHMGGRKASFRADRILDEPVITLAEANRV